MSVHSTFYQSEEEYKADLAYEYRTEQAGLYYHDDEEPEDPDCESCIHNHYLYTKADGTKVWECDTHECEYKENGE